MAAGGARPTKRGRRPRLSRDQVVDAATRILLEEGVESLTIRAVGTALGSSPMAVYRHVQDKDHLLVLVLDQVAAEIPRPRLPKRPRARVIKLWCAIHACLTEHAWAVEVLAAGDKMGPSILWFMERTGGALRDAGLSERESVRVIDAIWRLTIGSLLVQRGYDALTGSSPEASMQRALYENPDRDAFPVLATLSREWEAVRARNDYRAHLGALLDGLHEWD
ncbi:MAG: TetR/AcrR family transcriptional regulator [bacterium]|nr:TetR/AcrR family transcriptional regulator [bacterium]